MIEALAGTGLAAAAGLNAYIPLLALGLLGRFTDIVSLPSGWSWLENPWVLGVFGALLLLEVVADKIPAVDHLNDLAQTLVRPAAGGIVFGSGTAAETPAVSDPGAFFSGSWVPIATGVVVALVVHLIKAAVRAAANAAFAGVGAPVLSTAEDGLSVILVAAAILFPILVLVALAGAVVLVVLLIRRWRRRAAGRHPSMGVASSTPGT